MDYQTIGSFFLFGLVIWFWIDSMRTKEIAVKYCKRQCEKEGGQFLDQTVELNKLRLQRNSRGVVQFRREYSFEYSYEGIDRLTGFVVVLGNVVQMIHIDPPPQKHEFY